VNALKKCRLCDQPLPFLARITRANFCCTKHEDLYAAKQATLSINRILDFAPPTGSTTEYPMVTGHAIRMSETKRALAQAATPQMARVLGLKAESFPSQKKRVPEPSFSLLREDMFQPLAWSGTRTEEPQLAAFVPQSLVLPFLPEKVRPDEIPFGNELDIVRSNRTAEVMPRERSLWPVQTFDTETQQHRLFQAQVVGAEMRSAFALGPAGLIQIITAVVYVRDEKVMTPNTLPDASAGLSTLFEAVGRSIMAPNAKDFATAEDVAPSEPGVATKKARPRHALRARSARRKPAR
jgi:hypothetical protein